MMPYQLKLFPTPHDQAVTDMVTLFQQQLKEASTEAERVLIRMAIKGWESTLGEPKPFTERGSKRSRTSSIEHHG